MIDTEGVILRTKEVLGVNRQMDLAKYFKVTDKQITEWKKGNATPPYKKFIELAEQRSISLHWFFFGQGDKINRLNSDLSKKNHFSINIPIATTEDERRELEEIARYIDYTPKAFVQGMIKKMQDFKIQCDVG